MSVRRPSIRLRLLSSFTLAAVVALALPACGGGSDRSPEAYCTAFFTKAAPIRQSYVEANKNAENDPLTVILKSLSSPGDLQSIFDGMVDHAPDDIKFDTVIVRDAFKDLRSTMGDAISNPLGAIAQGLGSSLSSAGAFQRVGNYLDEHCPVTSELAQKIIKKSDAP
jgi:hypothetical protein